MGGGRSEEERGKGGGREEEGRRKRGRRGEEERRKRRGREEEGKRRKRGGREEEERRTRGGREEEERRKRGGREEEERRRRSKGPTPEVGASERPLRMHVLPRLACLGSGCASMSGPLRASLICAAPLLSLRSLGGTVSRRRVPPPTSRVPQ